MTTNRMGLEQLSDERLEQYANDKRMCNINDEIRNMARELLAYRKASKEADGDDNFYSWFSREWEKYYQPNQYATSAKQHLGAIAESAWFACRASLQAAMVPDGWKLVPIEPTYQMSKAIGLPWEQPPFPLRWKRMLEACPSPKSVTNEP